MNPKSSPVEGTGTEFTTREVVVTATDPDGEVLSIRVDIRVTDVDEAPIFANELTREAIIMENSTGTDLQVGTYDDTSFATDPEGIAIGADGRSIGGDDGGAFEFDPSDNLQFIASPDYEDPGDADEDNLYELTVVATDTTGMTSSLAVTVKVTNDPTDDDDNAPGTLEIFNRQPEVNTLLSVEGNPVDPDDGVKSIKWQWYWWDTDNATEATLGSPVTCPTPFVPTDDTDGDPDLNATSTWMKIVGATSSSYLVSEDRVDDWDTIPTRPDNRMLAGDAFDCLMVRASYLDGGPRSANDSSTVDYDESRQYAYAISEFSVQNQDTANADPVFADGDTALAGTQVRLRIQENFPHDVAGIATAILDPVALASPTNPASSAGDFLMDPVNPTEGEIRIFDGTISDADGDGTIDPFEVDTAATPDGYDDIEGDGTHKLTFRISGPDVDSFELVDKATGAINFTASPDYEVLAQRRYTVVLTAHDPTNFMDSITVIVDVENVDEPPMFTGGGAAVPHDENSTDSTGSTSTVETYTADDPESDRYFWGLTGTDAALFDIGVIDGKLTFRNAPNYEDPEDGSNGGSVADDGVYDVVVHLLLDGESLTDEDDTPAARMMAVAITVVDVDEAPVFTKTTDDNDMVVATELNIAENKQPDTMRNRAVEFSPQASDEDEIPEDVVDGTNNGTYASVMLVYTISGTGTEALSIVPATGELRTTRVLDYESGDRSFEVTVTATDPTKPDGLKDSIELVINVTDEDEAPVGGGTNQAPQFASSAMTRSVLENTEAGMDIGNPVTATDDDGNIITHTLGGTDVGDFRIDEATGQLMTSGALDYESKSSYTVTVTATDDDETKPLSSETTVTIMVTDVKEPGTVTLNPAQPSIGTEITATVTDLDIVDENTVSWQWASSDTADGTYANINGATSATYTPVDADANMWLRAMATYTDGFDSGNVEMAVSASAVTEVPVNVAPEFPSASTTRSIAENTVANTNIGAPVTATDPNDDTLTYSLEGMDSASFGINDSTGQLSTLAALNYEAKRTYNVVVRASDPDRLSDTIDVTITVTDVDEVVPMTVQDYDPAGDGIDIEELFKAIDDFFDDVIGISLLFEVIDAFFTNNG